MSDEIINAPIPYIKTFDPSKLPRERIEYTDDSGDKNSYKFPTFSGELKDNAEAFLHCISYFERHAVNRLHMSSRMFYDRLEDIFTDVALDHFVNSVQPDCEDNFNDRNWQARYDHALKEMKLRFCGGREARDLQVKYLKSSACKKKASASVPEHVGRIQMLFNYTEMLPGWVQPPLTEPEKKQILNDTFPDAWANVLYGLGRDYTNLSIGEIQEFMIRQKVSADKQRALEKNARRNEANVRLNVNGAHHQANRNTRTHSFSGRGRGRHNTRRPPNPNTCHKHPNGNHTWAECFQNPRNSSNSNSRSNYSNSRPFSNNRGRRNNSYNNRNRNYNSSFNPHSRSNIDRNNNQYENQCNQETQWTYEPSTTNNGWNNAGNNGWSNAGNNGWSNVGSNGWNNAGGNRWNNDGRNRNMDNNPAWTRNNARYSAPTAQNNVTEQAMVLYDPRIWNRGT